MGRAQCLVQVKHGLKPEPFEGLPRHWSQERVILRRRGSLPGAGASEVSGSEVSGAARFRLPEVPDGEAARVVPGDV
jgi:hypothetical protein